MTKIQLRRGTKSQLDLISLSSGEVGFTTDTNEIYAGNSGNKLIGAVMVGSSLSSRPTASVAGRKFFNTTTKKLYIDDGSNWNEVVGSGSSNAVAGYQLFTNQSVGTTVLNLNFAYDVGTNQLLVSRNGSEQIVTIDYTETSTTSITLATAITSTTEVIEVKKLVTSVSTYRNLIVNGNMRIDQRQAGNALSISGGGAYTIDRWKSQSVGPTSSLQQVTDAPSNSYFDYSLKLTATTGVSSPASTDNCSIHQWIEGYTYRRIKGKTATLSFWVKASKTGTMCVAFTNYLQNYSYVVDVTINAANTWEKKTITLTFNSSGTWYTDNRAGVDVIFSFMSGSTYQTSTTDSWVSGTYVASTNQTNFVSTNNDTIQITGVQLEEGNNVTDFEFRDFGTELALCQRYYCKSFRYGTKPATNAGTTGATWTKASGNGSLDISVGFPTFMRAIPTVTYYSPNTNDTGKWSLNGVQPLASSTSTTEFTLFIFGSGANNYYGHYIHWTADAEL